MANEARHATTEGEMLLALMKSPYAILRSGERSLYFNEASGQWLVTEQPYRRQTRIIAEGSLAEVYKHITTDLLEMRP